MDESIKKAAYSLSSKKGGRIFFLLLKDIQCLYFSIPIFPKGKKGISLYFAKDIMQQNSFLILRSSRTQWMWMCSDHIHLLISFLWSSEDRQMGCPRKGSREQDLAEKQKLSLTRWSEEELSQGRSGSKTSR